MSSQRQSTILIVDDEKINILSLSKILAGYAKVYFAMTGREALDLIDKQPVDLVLLDIMLPDISGFEVCQILKNNRETVQTPVVFITSLQREEEEARGLRLGALDYIRKPFNPTIVQARVQNLLNVSRAYQNLEKLSTTDFLTGAYNRRYFVGAAETELRRQRRSQGSMTLLALDIDHFKRINDTFGHSFGDLALKHLVTVCHSQIREVDIFARIGGEEFALLLPDSDEQGARDVARRLCRVVTETPLHCDGAAVVMSVSIGLTCQPARLHEDLAVLLEQADQALYRAKACGRNCAVSFAELSNPLAPASSA